MILVLVGVLTYLPSVGNQFLWDDEQFIYRNQYVLNFDLSNLLSQSVTTGAGNVSNYYRPLTSLTFAFDHWLWGLRPFGFHLTNTFFHVGTGVLIFLILRELGFDGLDKKKRSNFIKKFFVKGKNDLVSWRDPSWWLALIFLVHPIQTEAVVYVNSRGDSLYAALSMLGLYVFTRSLNNHSLRIKTWIFNSKQLLVAAVVSFWLALFAKEIALATVGLYGLVLGIYLVRDYRAWRAEFTKVKDQFYTVLALVASAGIYLWLRSSWWNFQDSFNFYTGQNIYTQSLWVRLITFTRIVIVYFRLLLWPYPLHMERTVEIMTTPWQIWSVLFVVVVGGWIASSVWEWRQHRTAWIGCGGIWFAVMLAPVSGIIPINGLLYEHWLYLPMVGFFLALCRWLQLVINKFPIVASFISDYKYWLLIPLFSIWAALTIRQNYLWRAPIPFYEYTLKHTDSARLHNNLAMAYDQADLFEKAVNEYQTAISLADVYPQTHHNLAQTYLELGQVDQARTEYERALAMSPSFHFSYLPLINIYVSQGEFQLAYNLAIKLKKLFPDDQRVRQIVEELKVKLPVE